MFESGNLEASRKPASKAFFAWLHGMTQDNQELPSKLFSPLYPYEYSRYSDIANHLCSMCLGGIYFLQMISTGTPIINLSCPTVNILVDSVDFPLQLFASIQNEMGSDDPFSIIVKTSKFANDLQQKLLQSPLVGKKVSSPVRIPVATVDVSLAKGTLFVGDSHTLLADHIQEFNSAQTDFRNEGKPFLTGQMFSQMGLSFEKGDQIGSFIYPGFWS